MIPFGERHAEETVFIAESSRLGSGIEYGCIDQRLSVFQADVAGKGIQIGTQQQNILVLYFPLDTRSSEHSPEIFSQRFVRQGFLFRSDSSQRGIVHEIHSIQLLHLTDGFTHLCLSGLSGCTQPDADDQHTEKHSHGFSFLILTFNTFSMISMISSRLRSSNRAVSRLSDVCVVRRT